MFHLSTMYSLFCSAIFVIPASFVVAVIAEDYHSPFGVTFSPSAIFTSRYNASGRVHTTKHPTSPEYITYFNDALDIYGQPDKTDPLTHYHSRAYNATWSVFEASIDPVTATLTKELGHKPEYRAVFIPSIFHRDVIGAAGEAVFRVHDQPNMIGHNPLAATAAYKFLECAHLGRAPEECNDEGPVNYVLVLEYEKEYLGAMLKEVEFYLGTFPPKGDVVCMECGERYREVCVNLQTCSYIYELS
jgi:hypothetical protein